MSNKGYEGFLKGFLPRRDVTTPKTGDPDFIFHPGKYGTISDEEYNKIIGEQEQTASRKKKQKELDLYETTKTEKEAKEEFDKAEAERKAEAVVDTIPEIYAQLGINMGNLPTKEEEEKGGFNMKAAMPWFAAAARFMTPGQTLGESMTAAISDHNALTVQAEEAEIDHRYKEAQIIGAQANAANQAALALYHMKGGKGSTTGRYDYTDDQFKRQTERAKYLADRIADQLFPEKLKPEMKRELKQIQQEIASDTLRNRLIGAPPGPPGAIK